MREVVDIINTMRKSVKRKEERRGREACADLSVARIFPGTMKYFINLKSGNYGL
jgi:hypothetical protein